MELNLRTVVELVEKVIQERGENYVYTNEETYLRSRSCTNVLFDIVDTSGAMDSNSKENKTNFRPGCIVGSAVLAAELMDMDWFFLYIRNNSPFNTILDGVKEEFGVPYTNIAYDFLGYCQERQDSYVGFTWKQAYDYAWEKVLKNSLRGRDFYNASFVPDQGDLEYIQELFGDFRPEEKNAAVGS